MFKRVFSLLWTEGDEESKAPRGTVRLRNKQLHKEHFHDLFFNIHVRVFFFRRRAAIMDL